MKNIFTQNKKTPTALENLQKTVAVMQKGPFQPTSSIATVDVTPEMATEWLSKTPPERQRPTGKIYIRHLAEMMSKGQFQGKLSNDLVQISTSGEVVNGQHRLNAIVLSNTTQTLKVETNVPWESFKVADRGRNKSLRDDMFMSGLNGKLSSVLSALNAILLGSKTNETPSLEEAKALFDAYEDGLVWIDDVYTSLGKERNKILQSFSRAAFVIAYMEYPEETVQFMKKYLTGANCEEGEAPLVLRNAFQFGGRKGLSKDPGWTTGFKTLQALDYFVQGVKIKQLRRIDTSRSMYNMLNKFTTPLFTLDN